MVEIPNIRTEGARKSGIARPNWWPALKAACLYFFSAILWFGLADHLPRLVIKDTQTEVAVRGLLGFSFIILTAILISLIVRRELSRQYRAQIALQESEARKAAILESALDCIITFEEEGRILEANPATEATFGFARAEIRGHRISELVSSSTPSDGHQSGLRDYFKPDQQNLLGRRIELVARRRTGEEFPIELAVTCISRDGPPLFTATIRDITQRETTEKALREARGKLEQHAKELEATVHERTISLRGMIAELEAFSYSLSHDMKAPLRAMQSFSQLLLNDYGEKIGNPGRDYLGRIARAAGRLDRLIEDMLRYSRCVNGELALKTVDLDQLISELIEERPDLQNHKSQIEIHRPLLPVQADEAALGQCVSNLLENAIKFVAPGVPPTIRVWTERIGSNVRLWVRDNGIGVPSDAQSKIFGMFQRLHGEGSYAGTGIGLTIVRKAAERMHGRVGLESESGAGSRFWIELQG